jgi:hypothetical protein
MSRRGRHPGRLKIGALKVSLTDSFDARQSVRGEVLAIAERFEAADKAHRLARTDPDRELAEAKRRDANGQFWAAAEQLADLHLLMLRQALAHRADALRQYLAELLRPELEPLAEALARLERGRK